MSEKLTIAIIFDFIQIFTLSRVTIVTLFFVRWNADSFQFSPTSPQMPRAGGLSNNK